MYSLICFVGETKLTVLPNICVRRLGSGKVTAKYKGAFYDANVLATAENPAELWPYAFNITNGYPQICLERVVGRNNDLFSKKTSPVVEYYCKDNLSKDNYTDLTPVPISVKILPSLICEGATTSDLLPGPIPISATISPSLICEDASTSDLLPISECIDNSEKAELGSPPYYNLNDSDNSFTDEEDPFKDDEWDDPDYHPLDKENEQLSVLLDLPGDLTESEDEQKSNDVDACSITPESLRTNACDLGTTSVTTELFMKKKRLAKPHCCFYCQTMRTNMVRHLTYQHSNEKMVTAALDFPKGSVERKLGLEKIWKMGDFQYNQNAQLDERISVRKSNKPETTRFIPCPYCKGYYSIKNLRNHVRENCLLKKAGKINLFGASRLLLANVHPTASDLVRKYILPSIRRDDYFELAVTDQYIIQYANNMAEQYLNVYKHHDHMITQNVRMLCRIFLKMKESIPQISSTCEMIMPCYYQNLIEIVKEMAVVYPDGSFKHPTVASFACNVLRHFAITVRLLCKTTEDDEDKDKKIEKFLFLLKFSQNILLTKRATESRSKQMRKKTQNLPTTKQINELLQCIEKYLEELFEELLKGFNCRHWNELSKLCLIFIQIYNRKRPGDIERALLAEYENRSIIDRDNLVHLSDDDKHYAENLARFVTRGKLNRSASVLIPRKVIKAMELILKYRSEAEVPDSNQFLFADPREKRYPFYKAQDALKIFCSKHNFNYNLFMANKIRKHLASCTTSLDKDRQQVVSDFMGHSMAIHKNIYQLPLIQKDILTMGKILSQAGGYSTKTNNDLELVTEAATSLRPDWLEDSDQNTDDEILHENIPLLSELSDVQEVSMEIDESFQESTSKVVKVTSVQETSTKSLMVRKPPRVRIPRNLSSDSSQSDHSIIRTPTKRLSLSNANRVTYTTPERKTLREAFKNHFRDQIVPSISECKDLLCKSNLGQTRTVAQIQSWVRAEMKRKMRSIGNRAGWTTPQKEKCRTFFKDYYNCKKALKYPSEAEFWEAIHNVPEFKNKTTNSLRSHMQHDYHYVQKHNIKI